MKQKYYSIDNLISKKAIYNILLGERSNGKSYATKKLCLWEAYHEKDFKTGKPKKRYQFGYLRRWREEIKSRDIELYFADMPIEEITNGEFNGVYSYRNDIFLKKEEDGKIVDKKLIGSAFALSMVTHYKSLAFPNIGNIIFEEFITSSGYLGAEVKNLNDLISTIARRQYVRVFMIGNTISRLCPYFDEWQLSHIKTQEQGTIEIYNQTTDQYDEHTGKPIVITIAVEYCANSGNTSKMFFGNKAKMITTGVWETDEQPHLPKKLNQYETKYQVFYEYGSNKFILNLLRDLETKEILLYVYPTVKECPKKIKRIVTDKFNLSPTSTLYLTKVLKYDTLIMKLINDNKVCFSDNLTGTEFKQVRKERGGY